MLVRGDNVVMGTTGAILGAGKAERPSPVLVGEAAWGLFLEVSINQDLRTWRVGVETGGSELWFLNLICSGRLLKKKNKPDHA